MTAPLVLADPPDVRPRSASEAPDDRYLPIGSVGDVAAARLVARTLLSQPVVAIEAADLVLATLILTASCLQAAHVARDEVGRAEIVATLRRLQRRLPGAAELSESPAAFVRYVGAEIEALSLQDARRVVRRLIQIIIQFPNTHPV